ncbi:MAG: hypothetical protein LCH61_16865, partial [Proteobacteria bacterium]|nr:hypothetical protein [Pseudomonadota bacterium]
YGLTARSAEMSRWLPDRVFTWTGLTPFTNAQRRAHAQAFMFQAGDLAGQTLAALDAKGGQEARFARWLKGFGIDEDGWGRIGAVRALDHGEAGGMLRPVDILDSAPGDRTMRDLALKYSEAMHALMEEATPGGTARARTALGMDARKGTPAGELTRSVTMYLSYPTTVIMSLINATSQEAAGGAARGASFLIGTLATLTLGGAMIVQMQALRQGRDLRGVFDDPAFWAEAATKGGGLGFYGDWVFADYKRDGVASTARLAGPVAGLIGDTFSVLNSKGFLSGEETNRSERAVQFARRNLPGLSMWPVKPFTDRLIFDRLQAAANPDAYDAWKRRERDLMREHGQGTWWRRGEASPHRAPDMSLW